MKKIYTTVGVYGDQSYVVNGVRIKDLPEHVKYNINHRIGRALFVDGICIHHGFLTIPEVLKWEQKIANDPEFTLEVDTAPYM